MAVSLSGTVRQVMTDATTLDLQDIAPDGSTLISSEQPRVIMEFLGPGSQEPRDLSWYDNSIIKEISRDGQWILFEEFSEPFGADYAVAARKVDGSPPIHLGAGSAGGLSPDGKWALDVSVGNKSARHTAAHRPGTSPALSRPAVSSTCRTAPPASYPMVRHIVLNGNEPGRGVRGYKLDLTSGNPLPITPEGTEAEIPSPDGHWMFAQAPDAPPVLCSLDTGEIRPIPGD